MIDLITQKFYYRRNNKLKQFLISLKLRVLYSKMYANSLN